MGNCGSGRACKMGVFSYSCDDPNTEQEVSDRIYTEPSRDCFTFNKECEGCRGYLDSCCSSKNCGSGRVCKQGVFSYSCDDPNTEQEVSDRIYTEPSRDCFTFNKECEGCRGYLDS